MAIKRILEGLSFVGIGLILLANTTGVLPWGVWWTILALWPVLLVAAGIDIIGRSLDNDWVRSLSSLLVLAALAYGAFVLPPGGPLNLAPFQTAPAGQSYQLSEPHDPAVSQGGATVRGGVGRVTLKGGSDLASAQGTTPFGRPALNVTKSGGNATVEIASSTGRGPFVVGPATSFMDATLDREVVWNTITLDAGLTQTNADLSDLDVRSLTADLGLSNTTLTFGDRAASARADVSAGLSTVTLRVPSSLGVELDVNGGLGSVKVGSGLSRESAEGSNSVWRSDGFSSASRTLVIHMDAGLSSVQVERY